ncbi:MULTISPECIES: RICIN domain-containing protein [Streptomyces]|uniref:RICIN domain-containing protein n=1 Tax=Streptomyces TaxID=1883 RepID=UPI00369AC596
MKRRTGRRIGLLSTAAVMVTSAALVTGPSAGGAEAAAGGAVGIAGKCLEAEGGATADGTAVRLADCTGDAAQDFSWESDGTVRILGRCLDITNGSDADGALVQLYGCGDEASKKFRHLPDGTIYSARSGKCLAVQGESAVGSRVGLDRCDPRQEDRIWSAETAPGPEYTLTGSAPVAYDRPDDTPAGVFTAKDGTFYYQQAHALYSADDPRKWSFYSGTDFDHTELDPISQAVNPDNPEDRNDDTTWRCNNSPTGKESTKAPDGSSYAHPNYCDLAGVWVDPDSGDWYGLVHNEFTPQPFGDGMHFDGIDYAVSQDQGSTWTIRDHVITSPYSTERGDTAQFPHETYHYGDGDPRLFVDNASGYFYVFYASRVLGKAGGGQTWLQHVARAPIAEKMAPSSWRKWHDGRWESPGTGGEESNIIPSDGNGPGYTTWDDDYDPSRSGTVDEQVAQGTMPDNSQLAVMNVTWSAYLNKYIGTPQNNNAQLDGTNDPLHFYSTDDLATQKWEDMGSVDEVKNGAWYRWFLDSETKTTSSVVGRTFRAYCSIACSTYGGEYSDVTIEPTSAKDLAQAPVTKGAQEVRAAGSGSGLSVDGARRWKFAATGDGFYTVTDVVSKKRLRVADGREGRAWDADVTLGAADAAAGPAAQWYFQKVVESPADGGASRATGEYRLINRHSGLALSLGDNGSNRAKTEPPRADSAQLLSFRR